MDRVSREQRVERLAATLLVAKAPTLDDWAAARRWAEEILRARHATHGTRRAAQSRLKRAVAAELAAHVRRAA